MKRTLKTVKRWYTRLRIYYYMWRDLRRIKKAVLMFMELPPDEAACILVKWKWDASHNLDPRMRETYLQIVDSIEAGYKKFGTGRLQ